MYCDPKNATLLCPDIYCANANLTYTVCQYSSLKDPKTNKTSIQFESCPDITGYSSLSCNNLKSCLSVLVYAGEISAGASNNSSASIATKNAARCVVGHAPDESHLQRNISSISTSTAATSLSASTIADMHQTLMYAPLLILLCLITIFKSRAIASAF